MRRGSQPSGALVVAALPLRHPRLTATVLLWALGLCIAFLARPPAITPEQMVAFKAKLKQVRPAAGALRHRCRTDGYFTAAITLSL